MRRRRGTAAVAGLILVDAAALALGGRPGIALSAVGGLALLGLALLEGGRQAAAHQPTVAADDADSADGADGADGANRAEDVAPERPGAPDRSTSAPPEAPAASAGAVQAQRMVDENAGAVIQELCELIDQVDTVRRSAFEVDEHAARTESVSRGTIDRARIADERVAELTASLADLAGTTQLIAGVAGQTRMLALNATIEAARAGEAGAGFAVVAGEVKTLAASTAESTDRIAETLGRLDGVARSVAEALTTMSTEIAGLDDASSALAGVASRQFGLVDRLDAALAGTVQKVTAWSSVSDRQERRGAERREVQAPLTLTWPDGSVSGEVRDLSSTGLRCALNGTRLPEAGTEVNLEVRARAGTFRTPAVVAREIPAAHGREFGLFFTRVPAEAASTITAVLGAAPPPSDRPAAGPASTGGPAGLPSDAPAPSSDDDLLAGIDLF